MYVCICHALSDQEIEQVVRQGAANDCEIFKLLGIQPKCGSCSCTIQEMVKKKDGNPHENAKKVLEK